jgi:hypothetical protein
VIRDPEGEYHRLVGVKRWYGWSTELLQEALRQEWEIHYGKRKPYEGGLAPLVQESQKPPERVIKLRRRVAKPNNLL